MFDIPTHFSEALRLQNDKLLAKLDRIIELLEAQEKRRPTKRATDVAKRRARALEAAKQLEGSRPNFPD